jgi:predicted dehydrogenase
MVHLSRDWKTTSLYLLEFEKGTLRLEAGNADRLELQLDHSNLIMDGRMKEQMDLKSSGHAVSPALSFQQAFLAQLQDLILAIRMNTEPAISAEEGIRSLRLIEQCYQKRTLMDMPWLTAKEYKSGQILALGGGR